MPELDHNLLRESGEREKEEGENGNIRVIEFLNVQLSFH